MKRAGKSPPIESGVTSPTLKNREIPRVEPRDLAGDALKTAGCYVASARLFDTISKVLALRPGRS